MRYVRRAIRWVLRWLNAQPDQGILLPGWTCQHCGVFNGAGKEILGRCRVCDRPR